MQLEHEIYFNVVRGILNHRNSESTLGISSNGPQMQSCVGAMIAAFCFLAGGSTFVFEGAGQGGSDERRREEETLKDPLGWSDP